jgi:hypothetical protein
MREHFNSRFARCTSALLIALALSSCISTAPERFTQEALSVAVRAAREEVLQSPLDLDERSRRVVQSLTPTFKYYKTGADFGQYSISWNITSNRLVKIMGNGFVRRLGGATLYLTEIDSKSGNLKRVIAEHPVKER